MNVFMHSIWNEEHDAPQIEDNNLSINVYYQTSLTCRSNHYNILLRTIDFEINKSLCTKSKSKLLSEGINVWVSAMHLCWYNEQGVNMNHFHHCGYYSSVPEAVLHDW